MNSVNTKNIEKIGEKIGSIPVSISYRIIELFSAGLYSSPNKAFEELVCNSYDAFATKVTVYVSSEKTASDAVLWVCDNGESMDRDGLKLLWKIGETNKRDQNYNPRDRPPIGKFGIGKLATYVLANKLTYICKSRNEYLAVTMDFSKIKEQADGIRPTRLELDEKKLTEEQVIDLINPLIKINGKKLLNFDLWGENAEKSWVFVIMSDLKQKAQQIQDGRLRWILRTALPLNPNFKLYFNGQELLPSKADIEPLRVWIIGQNDKIVEKYEEYSIDFYKGKPCVNLPHLKNIYGKIELYRDSLLKGKSRELGRSHGIFLKVRERLVNLDDPLLSMPAMTHGVFNRIRMIIHADKLDEYLPSTRESIKESDSLHDLHRYIQRKFDEARSYYFNLIQKEEEKKSASYKVWRTSASLSRRPLLTVARKFFDNEIDNLILTYIPDNLTKNEQAEIIEQLEEDLTSEKGIIQNISWEAIGSEEPVSKFDLKSRTARINLLHPFFANFLEEVKSPLPFQLIAIMEILMEASMIEIGIDPDQVRKMIWRRDQLLREFAFSDKSNAPLVAQMIQATLSDPGGLEDAVFHAFSNLGFETAKIGGRGKPDGKAVAILGVRDPTTGIREDYSLVYDAKSTIKGKIKAGHARISAIDRHRDSYKANYAVVVAIDFEGAEDPNSAISLEAKKHKITLIRAKDLMTLLLIASPKKLNFLDFRDLFENCHTVIETSEWIKKAKERKIEKQPIRELLETIYKLMKEDKEPPELASIRMTSPILRDMTKQELKTLVLSLQRLVGNLISLEGEIVSIRTSPQKILNSLKDVMNTEIPSEFLDLYLQVFES